MFLESAGLVSDLDLQKARGLWPLVSAGETFWGISGGIESVITPESISESIGVWGLSKENCWTYCGWTALALRALRPAGLPWDTQYFPAMNQSQPAYFGNTLRWFEVEHSSSVTELHSLKGCKRLDNTRNRLSITACYAAEEVTKRIRLGDELERSSCYQDGLLKFVAALEIWFPSVASWYFREFHRREEKFDDMFIILLCATILNAIARDSSQKSSYLY